jgi:hypothetical protein
MLNGSISVHFVSCSFFFSFVVIDKVMWICRRTSSKEEEAVEERYSLQNKVIGWWGLWVLIIFFPWLHFVFVPIDHSWCTNWSFKNELSFKLDTIGFEQMGNYMLNASSRRKFGKTTVTFNFPKTYQNPLVVKYLKERFLSSFT